jgi:uncharacterized MnhB-related membrane protein
MLPDALPALLGAMLVISGIFVFVQRKLLHAVTALAAAAAVSALMFLYLDQALVALLQLLIFIGGLSTYLMVAVAAEEKFVNMRSVASFAAAFVLLGAVLADAVYELPAQAYGGTGFVQLAESAIGQYYGLILASIFLLFAAAIASVLVIKRFVKLVS